MSPFIGFFFFLSFRNLISGQLSHMYTYHHKNIGSCLTWILFDFSLVKLWVLPESCGTRSNYDRSFQKVTRSFHKVIRSFQKVIRSSGHFRKSSDHFRKPCGHFRKSFGHFRKSFDYLRNSSGHFRKSLSHFRNYSVISESHSVISESQLDGQKVIGSFQKV